VSELDLTLLRAPCRITQRFKNIVSLDVRIVRKKLVDGTARADLANNHPDRYAHSANARLAAHDGGISRDASKVGHVIHLRGI
jgi:hypothetical protein